MVSKLLEIVTMSPHQGKQSAILGADSIDVPPTSQEVMIDQTDDMETVGQDRCVGEVQPDQGAIVRG